MTYHKYIPTLPYKYPTIYSFINNYHYNRSAETYDLYKLAGRYLFEPIAVETTGVYGDTTASIVHEIGWRIATGDPREWSPTALPGSGSAWALPYREAMLSAFWLPAGSFLVGRGSPKLQPHTSFRREFFSHGFLFI